MDVYEIRHRNLLLLVARAGGPKKFGELVDKSTSQISQYTTRAKNIGSGVAREMEEAMKQPAGWLDQLHAGAQPDKEERSEKPQSVTSAAPRGDEIFPTLSGGMISAARHVPVVGTAQLGSGGYWAELEYPVGHGDGYLPIATDDRNAYAVRCRGDSMAPAIPDRWFAVVEPNSPPMPGEFVLIKTTDGQHSIKKLLYQTPEEVAVESVNATHPPRKFASAEIVYVHHIGYVCPPSKWKL